MSVPIDIIYLMIINPQLLFRRLLLQRFRVPILNIFGHGVMEH